MKRLKGILIPSISIATMMIAAKPAMAQSSTASAKSSTEAQASSQLSTEPAASGINLSKIPLAAVKNAQEKPKVFVLTVGLERGSNMVAEGSALDKTTTTFLFSPKINITENLSVSTKTFIERQENGSANNTEASDTQISLSLKGSKWGQYLQPGYSLSGFAPTSESNRKDTRFQGAGGAGFKIAASFPMADVSYGFSYRRNVHEFTVAADGSANIRETLTQAVTLDIPVTSKWSLSFGGSYRNGWTYQNSNRQAFGIDGDINFEAIKNLSLNVGASNEGSALKANGKDSNIKFYDDKSSVIRMGVTYVL